MRVKDFVVWFGVVFEKPLVEGYWFLGGVDAVFLFLLFEPSP